MAGTHLAAFGSPGLDLLTEAAATLQGDVRRQATVLLGAASRTASTSPPEAPSGSGRAGDRLDGVGGGAVFADRAPTAMAAPMPDPIASVPELAAEAKHFLYEAEDPIRF